MSDFTFSSQGVGLRFELSARQLLSPNSSSSSATASSDELMSESYGSTPSPSPPSPPPSDQQPTNRTPLFAAWQEDTTAAFSTSSFFSLSSHSAPARQPLLSEVAQSLSVPEYIRSASEPSLTFTSTASAQSVQSSPTSSPFDVSVSLPTPTFSLQADSPRYVDTYLSLVSTDVYSFFDDTFFRSLYFEHIIHEAEPQPRTESRVRLLCVSAVLAIGARMYGNTAYSAQCGAVARHCARALRNDLPSSTEDIALTYRGLLALSYFSAAMLDPTEAEWLSTADSLISAERAHALVPTPLIHALHLMPPTFVDALSLPADDMCEQVVRHQRLLYSSGLINYRRCKRTLRQLISVSDDDDELSSLHGQLSEEGPTDISASMTSCSTGRLASLHLSVCLALSVVHRCQSIRFSVYDSLVLVLCCEAAALPTNQRAGVYGIKLGCYLLLGQRRNAVQAARDILAFHTGPGRLSTVSGADEGLMLPFAMSFVRSIVVLVEWDDGSHEVPSLVSSALRLFHGVTMLWPAARAVEAELIDRIHRRCREEMNRAPSQVHMERSSSASHPDTGRLQTAIQMELALEALEIEWQKREPQSEKEDG